MAQVGLLEDNTRIAKLCTTMLQHAGHQVSVYTHPRECLDALLFQPVTSGNEQVPSHKTQSQSIVLDVLILDINLPDINGLEVVNLLRSDPRTQNLPLIFCSAANTSEMLDALRLTPQASFIGKPFTFQELITAVSSALGQKTL